MSAHAAAASSESVSAAFALASSQRHEALKAQWEARREAAPAETAAFWESFGADKESILGEVSSADAALVLELESRGRALSASVTPATSWLSPFDVKRATREAKEVEAVVAAAKARLAPRRKFGFSARPPGEKKKKREPTAKKAIAFERSGFFGERRKVLTADDAAEVHLDDLEDCVVFLTQPVAALRVRALRRCVVFAVAVAGPAYVQDVRDSTLRLRARQLRVHDTHTTDFYVHLATGPIIEDCAGLRFARYAARWTTSVLPSSDLGLRSDAWNDVQDFKWLRAEPSPNFSLLPDADYALQPPPTAAEVASRLGLLLLAATEDDFERDAVVRESTAAATAAPAAAATAPGDDETPPPASSSDAVVEGDSSP